MINQNENTGGKNNIKRHGRIKAYTIICRSAKKRLNFITYRVMIYKEEAGSGMKEKN